MKTFDRKTSQKVVHQLRAATVIHKFPSPRQTFMRWWNVAGVLLHLLAVVDDQEKRIAELEKGHE